MKKSYLDKMKNYYRLYNKSRKHKLSDCYKTYSESKSRAFDSIKQLCHDIDAWGIKIITYNCQVFTAGYLYVYQGRTYFVVETPTKRYDILAAVVDRFFEDC